MRYHYEKPKSYISMYGITYYCDHPVYNKCTLFKEGNYGLEIIQQHYDNETKHAWWSEIDPLLTDLIYLHPKFIEYFKDHSRSATDG